MRSLSLAVFFAVISTSVYAQKAIGPVANLNIVNRRIAPDGFNRQATLVNDEFPGPLIQATKGANFRLNVINRLNDSSLDLGTSIHWHGILQRTTNYVDGAAFVTQCPIIPNESFLYQFKAFEQTGTYWYHSHLKAQYCDGLRGALVIYDPKDPHHDHMTLITFLSGSAGSKFNSTLINGKGRYIGGPSVPLAVYRLRVVSISCDPAFDFSIDGHQLTIIEVDGNNVQPLVVDSLEIFAATRVKVDPVPGKPFPGGADININLNVTPSSDFTEFVINGFTFDAPMVPVLLQILSGAQNASDLVPKGSIYGLDANKSVEITIPAGVPGGPHPIHLHGHSFHVVRSAGSSTYNFDNPVIRDVVSIGEQGDNVTIRFFTDNPGPWFLHCHIDWHLEKGFAVVFAEDVPEVSTKDIVNAQWRALCPAYNSSKMTSG
ncbi:Cupredoxin [Lactifluus volemus]|nr:Cupredoxin [Lactifluus volemus]